MCIDERDTTSDGLQPTSDGPKYIYIYIYTYIHCNCLLCTCLYSVAAQGCHKASYRHSASVQLSCCGNAFYEENPPKLAGRGATVLVEAEAGGKEVVAQEANRFVEVIHIMGPCRGESPQLSVFQSCSVFKLQF